MPPIRDSPKRLLQPGRNGLSPWFAAWFGMCLLFVVRVVAAAPRHQSAGPGGNATVVFQFNQNSNRDPIIWTGPFYSIAIPTATHANLRLESEQWMANLGTFQFSLDLNNNTGSTLKPSRGRVSISDLHFGRWAIKASAGDVQFDIYNLNLGLSSLYRPNISLRGFQVNAGHGEMQYSLFGGRTAAGTGYFAESALVSDQAVFGARAATQLSKRLALGMSLLHTTEPDPNNRSFSRATNSLTAGAVYNFTPHFQIAAETCLARYREIAAGYKHSGYDLSGLLGARIKSSRGSADISMLRLGPTYAPFSYTSVGDRAGISGSGDYRIIDRLSFYGSFNRWRNNLMARPGEAVIEMHHQFLGTNYRIGQGSNVGARIAMSGMHSSESRPAASRMKSIYLDFSHQWRKWRFTVRGNEVSSTDGNSESSQALRRRVDMEARLHLKNNTDIWASAGILRDESKGRDIGHQSQSGLAGSLGINWSPRPSLSLYSQAGWNQELIALSALKIDNIALNGGLSWLLPQDFVVRIEGRHSRDASQLNLLSTLPLGPEAAAELESYLRSNRNHDYQITFRIQKLLKWGKSPHRGVENETTTPLKPKSYGSIEGVVFEDLDNDGIMNNGEKGVSNVAVILDNEERIWVDSAGRFSYKVVPAGEHSLSLELVTIPASYDIGPRASRTVEVVKNAFPPSSFH